MSAPPDPVRLNGQAVVVQVMGWRSQQYGSFERFLVALSRALADRGDRCHFVFPAEPTSAEFVRDSAAAVHVLPSPVSPGDPRFMVALRSLFRATGATHLHAHFGVESYHALAVARAAGVRRRFTTKHITPGNARRTAARSRHRWLARQVDTFFAVSDHVARGLVRLGVPAAKIAVCHLGVDTSAYRPDPEARKAARDVLGIAAGERVLLSTSHLRPGKGTEQLPLLAASLLNDPGDVTVLVAGDGPLRGQLQQAAGALQLPSARFRMLGVRQDVPSLLAAADLFVFPTGGNEGMGLGPLEAACAGVPVVATRVSDLPDLLAGTAMLVPPGDLAALVEASRKVLDRYEEARDLAAVEGERLRAQLDVSRAANLHLEHYVGPRS
jgi:glycosyltransferase involved in cell wall biosynthesis